MIHDEMHVVAIAETLCQYRLVISAPALGDNGEAGDGSASKKPTEWKCHKVILCAASDFFYEKFILGGGGGAGSAEEGGAEGGGDEAAADGNGGAEDGNGGGDVVVIPALPNDPVTRKELDLTDAVPLALRYCYCNQDWAEIEPDIVDPVALFAAAALLKIKSLVTRSLQYLEETVLSRDTCASLFYHSTLLGPAAADLCEMARQKLLDEFCYLGPDDYAKLCRLPMESLLPLLQDDDLLVQDEGEVYGLVNRVLRTRLERTEQTLSLSGVKLSEAQFFVNQPVLFELVLVESGCAITSGSYYPPESERYSGRTQERIVVEPGTRGEFPFPEEEGFALALDMPSLYNTNVSALQAPEIVIRALKEVLPEDADPSNPATSDEVKVDNALRYEVIAEGILPKEAYVKQPTSPSMRRKLGLAETATSSAGEKKVAEVGGAGGGGDGGADAAEGGGDGDAAEAEEQPVYSVALKFKDDSRGEILFSVAVTEKGATAGDEEAGDEGAAAEGGGDAAAAAPGADGAEEGGGEGGDTAGVETGPTEVQANLPLTEVDVDALLDAVRFPYLQHQTLIEAARDPVLHEATAQHLVVEALSARLSAYEPGGIIGDVKPRNSLMRALVPVNKSGSKKQLALPDPKSPMKTLKVETKAAPVIGGVATLDNPFLFEQEQDFDSNGLLHFLATNGKKSAWKNPQGLGQVQVLKSGVGFGKSEDLVGREALNLRTTNAENSFFGIDLQTDRLFVCAGYFECSFPFNGTDQDGLPKAACRAFRVVQIGKNSSGSYNLGLSGIELYGKAVRGNYP
eukprot:g14954.t1